MDREGIRIGELAALAGVSTRAIRHYHRIGLLPEPARGPNGYRRYGQVDAVRLLQVRRLVELGLSLDEVADAMSGDDDADLREVLAELDADLARQADAIAARRARIAELLEGGRTSGATPEVAGLLAEWDEVAAGHPGAERERGVIELMARAAGEAAPAFAEAYGRVLADSDVLRPALDVYRRFEEIAALDPDDPVVEALVTDVSALLPALVAGLGPVADFGEGEPDPAALVTLRAVQADLTPPQQRVFELVLASFGGVLG